VSARVEETGAPRPESGDDLLRTPEAGGRVVRGGFVRGVGYAISTLVALATAVLLLRYLGLEDFGVYATVTAILGIVAGITDAGLTAVASRELAVARGSEERQRLLANLVALRIGAATLGALAALMFTVLAGYGSDVVLGTAIGGLGVVLISAQSMLTVPIWVELRIVWLTVLETLRNVLTLAFVALLVAAGAGLLSLFAVQIIVGLLLVPLTFHVARLGARVATGMRRETLVWLLRQTLPLAIAFAMSVIYFRVLVVLVSLLSSERETGLFGTSFRIFEVLLGAPALILSVALPLLSVAGDEDETRFGYALQRMTEISLLASALLAIEIGILAEPGLRLIGGSEYTDAAPVLRIQAVALVPLFLTMTWQLGLVAGRAQRAMVLANGTALAAVVALGLVLVPAFGAIGAACAAVAAETCLAALLLLALRWARPEAVPDLRAGWKVVLAAGVATAAGLALSSRPVLGALAAAGAFVSIAVLTKAVPPDVAHALGLGRRRRAR
jgi:O-antigen/teichoic acid export membrane protein